MDDQYSDQIIQEKYQNSQMGCFDYFALLIFLFLNKIESQIENTEDSTYISLAFVYFNLAIFLPHLSTILTSIFILLFTLHTLTVIHQCSNKLSIALIDRIKWVGLIVCLIMSVSVANQLNDPSLFLKIILFFNFTAVSFFL